MLYIGVTLWKIYSLLENLTEPNMVPEINMLIKKLFVSSNLVENTSLAQH